MNEADDSEVFYWGIECKTCNEQIVFGIRLHPTLGDRLRFAKPGTFRCLHMHKHQYDKDDFLFFRSASQVNEAGIRDNRSRYYGTEPVELDARRL